MQPKAFAVLACLLAAVPVSLAAAPGDLDAGFGANGLVIVNINNQQSFPAGLAIQDDGKIVIGGTNGPVGARDFMVIRGLPDATPDPAFGNNGVAVTPVGPGEDVARDIAVLPDGKILAVGSTDLNGGFDVAFVRYHPDGSLDGTFGTGGIVIAPLPSLFVFPMKMALQKDGRIVVAGASGTSGGLPSIFVARYLEDGTPDTGFDGDGFAEIQPGGNSGFAGGVAVQEDGKIVVAGSSGGPGDQDFTVVRLKADGSLDAGFDGDGVALTVFGADTSFAQGLALQPDGGIVAAGARQTSTVSQAVLVRYLADGSPDASFGSGGAVSTPIGLDGGVAAAVALQDNGSIVVAGTAQKGILDADSLLLRYLPNGDLDPDFAGAGLVTTDGGTNDHAAAVALQSDGKIVVEGQNDHDVILIRYEGDPPAPAPQPSSGGCDLIVR